MRRELFRYPGGISHPLKVMLCNRFFLASLFLGPGLFIQQQSTIPAQAAGCISLTSLGTAYTQNFDTLSTVGTANTLSIPGWDLLESGGGARDNEMYSADNGTSNTGDSSLNIANGASFWIRWIDTDASGADDGLAVDEFSLIPNGAGALPTLAVNDVSLNEGNAGTTAFTFTVTLSAPAGAGGVTCDISTADGTAATADNDYAARSLTGQTISAGNSTYTLSVPVNGDTTPESNETFFVNITNVAGVGVSDGQGLGTIINDDIGITPIHDIQGIGLTSPMASQVVTIRGIVVGAYQGASPTLRGFFVQEEDADADSNPATSEGIFLFSSTVVNRADLVQVSGTVFEYSTTSGSATSYLTELTSVTSVQVLSSGNTLPTATQVSLPFSSLSDFERYEGMLITFPQQLTVTDVFYLGRSGQVDLSVNGRLSAPTNIADPGAAAVAQADLNARSRVILDDASTSSNPDPVIHPSPGLSFANTLRVGDTTQNLTGILEDRFGAYRVQPVGTVNFTASNPRAASPPSVGGNLKVAGMNMLNYFVTLGTGLNCGPTGGLQCRGATDATEFMRQRVKLISAVTSISPDIAGLMEIENDPGNAAIQDLVNGLNAAAGAGTYSFISTGPIGTDAIRVGIIYKPGQVAPIGNYAILTSAVNPLFLDTKNRPSMAQTFGLTANGEKLTVVVNHLKSKGSDCIDVGDPDAGDEQGNCNLTRTNAVKAIAQWLATDPTQSGKSDYIIVGDMNAYAKEDPITAFKTAGYTDLVNKFLGTNGYSYVNDGGSGCLDHAIASPSLASKVTGLYQWHINADEPAALDYNLEYKSTNQQSTFYSPLPYRSSDHDPVIVGIHLAKRIYFPIILCNIQRLLMLEQGLPAHPIEERTQLMPVLPSRGFSVDSSCCWTLAR